jgi:NADH-quinone oxidoreductase subunit H
VTDVNVAVLVVFAIASMGVYGIVLAGLGLEQQVLAARRLRSAAQMISYELSYGMALAAVIMLAGSLSLREIVMNQSATGGASSPSGTCSCSRSASSSS